MFFLFDAVFFAPYINRYTKTEEQSIGKPFLAIVLFWITGVHLLLFFTCDPGSVHSVLLTALSWWGRATPGPRKITTIWSGSTQLPTWQLAPPFSAQLRARAICARSLPIQWVLEEKNREQCLTTDLQNLYSIFAGEALWVPKCATGLCWVTNAHSTLAYNQSPGVRNI